MECLYPSSNLYIKLQIINKHNETYIGETQLVVEEGETNDEKLNRARRRGARRWERADPAVIPQQPTSPKKRAEHLRFCRLSIVNKSAG